MKIYIASDHAGYEHKESIKSILHTRGYEIVDCGAVTYISEDDYPDYITPCAHKVADDSGSVGIVFGGSGQGEAMAANRISGVRCAVYYGNEPHTELPVPVLVREHNNANMLSIGARFVSVEDSVKAIELFLNTPFTNDERHVRRINKY